MPARPFAFVPLAAIGALLWGAEAAASHITNHSFEADGFINFATTPPSGWSFSQSDPDLRGDTLGLSTHGDWGARYFLATSGSVVAGDSARLSQVVDLMGVTSILFDLDLNCAPFGCGWHSFLQASFYIDGTEAWSSQALGAALDEVVDTSLLSGLHTIEFRLEALANGSAGGTSSHFSFDNVRVIPEPATGSLLALGLVGLVGLVARRARRARHT